MPANHVPTSQPCETCHSATSFTSFAGGQMNHAGISSGCATCHAAGKTFFGVVMKTPPATHIPFGGAACEACHSASTFSSFAGTPMNHGPVSSISCQTCHETGKSWFGVTIVTRPTLSQDPAHPQTGDCGQCHSTSSFTTAGKPANHIPTSQPCALCHSNPSDYSQATMNHAGITSGCATCHGPGLSFANVVPVAPPATHIPTSQPCEVCHSATTFTSFAGTQMNHAGITSGCATCHAAGKTFFGVVMKTPPATHIPIAGAACEACHSASNFSSFGGTPMSHGPVASISCSTCHETGKSWFGVTIVTRPTLAQDPAHPQTGDCGQCHSTSSFNTAGKPANHIPTSQPCALCHSNPNDYSQAMMNHAGITNGCATCHGPGLSFANVVPVSPPATHIPTSQPCEVCHSATTFTSFAGTQMNHAGITANCATCHAAGKTFFGVVMKTPPATHIPFGGAACEACHSASTFSSFANTPMNHGPVSSISCQTCHETGKSWFGVTIVTRPTLAQDPNHPQTGDCGQCHSTSSFATAGKPANHIPTSQPCALCHSNPSDYSQATMNHAGITSGCATCHGPGLSFANIVPKEPPATHIPTGQPCEVCHSATNFSSFAGTQMNHAGIISNCADCHAAGKTFFGVTVKTPPATHIPFGGAACEACHSASTFSSFANTPMNHGPVSSLSCQTCHETGKSWFGVSIVTRPTPAQDPNHPQTGDCGQCHNTSSFGTAGKPPNHIPTSQACALCHTNPADFSQATMNHTGITSGCATCHGPGLSFANIVPKEPPGTHIPYGGAACEACHSPTKFSSFSGTAMNHSAVASMKCVSCHEYGMSWFGVSIVTRPSPSHHPGVDCGQCHNTHSFDDAAAARITRAGTAAATTTPAVGGQRPARTGFPAADAHLGIAIGSCAGCHNGATAAGKPAKHLPTALSCDGCHRTTSWRPASFTHAGVAPGGCLACHNGNQARAKPASHFASARSCDACHRASTWAGARYQHLSPAYREHGHRCRAGPATSRTGKQSPGRAQRSNPIAPAVTPINSGRKRTRRPGRTAAGTRWWSFATAPAAVTSAAPRARDRRACSMRATGRPMAASELAQRLSVARGLPPRSRAGALGALVAALSLAMLPLLACAQVIDTIEVKRDGTNAQVYIRFLAQIQFLRYAPTERADQVQVYFQFVGADESVLSTREDLRRPPPNDLLPRFEVSYRAPVGLFQRRIDIRFANPVDFELRPDDKRTILLTIPLPADVLKRLAPAAAPPPPPAAVAAPPAPQPAPATAPAPPSSPAVARPEVESEATEAMTQAREAMTRRDYSAAVLALNRVLNLPPNRESRQAQEMIGLARENLGEIDKARVEYELYLKLYPDGPGADLVREHLAGLGAGQSAVAAPQPPPAERGLTAWGSLTQFYYGGQSRVQQTKQVTTPATGATTLVTDALTATDQSQLITTADVTGRWREGPWDNRVVVRDAYTWSFLSGQSNSNNLNAAYFETRHQPTDTHLLVGRSVGTSGGIIGRFDGALFDWGFRPDWRLGVYGGELVDSPPGVHQYFGGAAVDGANILPNTNGQLYAIYQSVVGVTDRVGLGGEVRYFDPVRSAYGIFDYDPVFRAVNIASLQATWQLPQGTLLNFLADYRRTPTLQLTNVVFPAQTSDISGLINTFGIDTVRAEAKAYTPISKVFLAGITQPFATNWQFGFDFRISSLTGTPGTAILPATPGTGNVYTYTVQLIGSSLTRMQDILVLNGTVLRGSLLDGVQAGVDYRFTPWALWSFEPSLKYYQQTDNLGNKISAWTPAIRVIYQLRERFSLEGEYDWQHSHQQGNGTDSVVNRQYFYIGWRWAF
jgi:hypothetical protein